MEERIGNVSTGLGEDTILKLLKQKKYSVETGSRLEAEPCCVCQVNLSVLAFFAAFHACAYLLKHAHRSYHLIVLCTGGVQGR